MLSIFDDFVFCSSIVFFGRKVETSKHEHFR